MIPKPLITYIRVSTSRQGRSGLGIEAQRQVLAQFAQAEGFEVVREFVEVETGKGSCRLNDSGESLGAHWAHRWVVGDWIAKTPVRLS
jgi:hypothetical protein